MKTLNLGLKGELTITPAMEGLGNSLFLDQIPESWQKKAYPSMAGLTAWYVQSDEQNIQKIIILLLAITGYKHMGY